MPYEVIHQKIAEMTPLSTLRYYKSFCQRKYKEKKNDLLFCKAHACASTSVFGLYLLPALLLMFFEVISHPDFFHQDLVFSHPPTTRFLRIFFLNLSELIEKAYFQGWLLIFLLIFHWKKCLFNVISASIRIAIFTFA